MSYDKTSSSSTGTDWDAAERGLTPDEWARVFRAGADAATAGQDLAAVLRAMATECEDIKRSRSSRHD